MVSIEAEECHLQHAAEFDSEVENSLEKRKIKLLQDENPFESFTVKCYNIAMKVCAWLGLHVVIISFNCNLHTK